MVEYHKSVCPLNCFDSCSLLVGVENGRVTKIKGNPEHPQTKGFTCGKIQKYLQRMYSIDRVKYPLQKVNGRWQRITWDQAYDIIVEKLTTIKEQHSSLAVLHNYDYGSNGALRMLDQRFFNAFGGVTVPEGSLCWGSGYTAQKYDFGGLQMHTWEDLLNAKTILIWGRNPGYTNIHLIPYILEAKKKGANILVINPAEIGAEEKIADAHIYIRPGTDGALALGMAHIAMRERWIDIGFINNHVHGFTEYAHMVAEYTPEKVAQLTDIPLEQIEELAKLYAKNKPSAILVGYGTQRYINGGQTIRAIDALAAITGNIGIAGGGVNYADDRKGKLLAAIHGKELAENERQIPRPAMATAMLEANNPPIKAVFVTRSNPIVQNASTEKMLEAFNNLDFIVVLDTVMNDTGDMAHLFLPVTTIFEEEDIVATSWNYYIQYAPKLVEPLREVKSDVEIFSELAKRMSLGQYFNKNSTEWLEEILAPAVQYGLNLAELKGKGAVRNPLMTEVAWANKEFPTLSGKIEIYSESLAEVGQNPLPEFVISQESPLRKDELSQEYPLHFLTPHPKEALNSQFHELSEDALNLPIVHMHPEIAKDRYISNNDRVTVESPRGQMVGIARITSKLRKDVIQVYQGKWIKQGGGVNFLTPEYIPDMGLGTPYYDCLCQVRKVMID